MYPVDIRNEKLGINKRFNFREKPTEKDIYDALKGIDQNTGAPYLDQQTLIENFDPANPTGLEDLVRRADDNGFFEGEEIDFDKGVEIATEAGESLVRGFDKILFDNPRLYKRLNDTAIKFGAKKLEADTTGFGTDVVYSDEADEQFRFGMVDKNTRQRLDQASLKLVEYASQDDYKDRPSLFKALDEFDLPRDKATQKEVARRAKQLGDSQGKANVIASFTDMAGGYAMLGDAFGDLVDGDDTQDENLLDLKQKFFRIQQMEDATLAVAEGGFLGIGEDRQLEVDLKKGLITPDQDVRLAGSIIGDPTNFGAPLASGLAVRGINRLQMGMFRTMINQAHKAEQSVNIAKRVLSKTEKSTSGFIAKNNIKARQLAQKTLDKNMKILDDLNPKIEKWMNKNAKAPMLSKAFGAGAKVTGYSADLLGRTAEFFARLPKELGTTLLMKFGLSEDGAKTFLGLGAGGLGISQILDNDGFTPNEKYILYGTIGFALGPQALQGFGTTLRHLGDQIGKPLSETTAMMRLIREPIPDPKLTSVLIDRTNKVGIGETFTKLGGQVFKKGGSYNFMARQALPETARNLAKGLDKTGLDKVASFSAEALGLATVGTALPAGFGYATMGDEGLYAGIGASLPIIGFGLGVGGFMRFASPAHLRVRQQGTVQNHRKILTEQSSVDQLRLFDSMGFESKVAVANFHQRHPDASLQIVDSRFDDGITASGTYSAQNGRGSVVVDLGSAFPLQNIIAHEVGHHIEASGLSPIVMDIMLGDAERGIAGYYSKRDADGNLMTYTDKNGFKRYQLEDGEFNNPDGSKKENNFMIGRQQYLSRLRNSNAPSSDVKAYFDDQSGLKIASEKFAEMVAYRIVSGTTSVDTLRGPISMLALHTFEAISGRPWMQKTVGLLGGYGSSKSDLFSQAGLPKGKAGKELNALIRQFERRTARMNLDERQGEFPVSSKKDEIIITPDHIRKNPNLAELFRSGGVFKTDKHGNIIKGIGGQPKMLSEAESKRIQEGFSKEISDQLDNLDDDTPIGHVTEQGTDKNGNTYYSGLFLNESIIDRLEQTGRYNPYQIETLRQMSKVGRKIASGEGDMGDFGNQFLTFYYKATGRGGKQYKTIRGEYKSTYAYGITVTKDKNILINMIDISEMDRNIDFLLGKEPQKIAEAFGGETIDQVKDNMAIKMRKYLSNHMQGIENTDVNGVTKEQKNYLNAVFGAVRQDQVALNPVLEGLGVKRSERMATFRSYRVDRIGTMKQVGEGAYINPMRMAQNLLPASDPLKYKYMPSSPSQGSFKSNLGFKDNILDKVIPSMKNNVVTPTELLSLMGKQSGALQYAEELGLVAKKDGKHTLVFEGKQKGKISKEELAEVVQGRSLNLNIRRRGRRGTPNPNLQWNRMRKPDELRAFQTTKYASGDTVIFDIEDYKTGEPLDTMLVSKSSIDTMRDVMSRGEDRKTPQEIDDIISRSVVKLYYNPSSLSAEQTHNLGEPITFQEARELYLMDEDGSENFTWNDTSEPYTDRYTDEPNVYKFGRIGMIFGSEIDAFDRYASPTVYDDASSFGSQIQEGQILPNSYEENVITVENGGKYSFDHSKQESSHWEGDYNVVAHSRTTARIFNNKRDDVHLHMEEAQSDSHQKGRKHGYYDQNPENYDIVKVGDSEGVASKVTVRNRYTGEENEVFINNNLALNIKTAQDPSYQKKHPLHLINYKKQVVDELLNRGMTNADKMGVTKVTDLPFKKSWPTLILKTHIKDALEQGIKKISWTSGQTQNIRNQKSYPVKRIDLVDGTQRVTEFEANKDPSESVLKRVIITTNNEYAFIVGVDENGIIFNSGRASSDYVPENLLRGVVGKGLDEVIGKPMANEVLNHKHEFRNFDDMTARERDYSLSYAVIKSWSGDGFQFGGQQFKNFYDKELVSLATKIGKKIGASKPYKIKEGASEGVKVRESWGMDLTDVDPAKVDDITLFMPSSDDHTPPPPVYRLPDMPKEKAKLQLRVKNATRKDDDFKFMPQNPDGSEYGMRHRPSDREIGNTLDDLSNIYPNDIYSADGARLYGDFGGKYDDDNAINVIHKAKGNPNMPVRIYRAVPKDINTINAEDWVTTVEEYAYGHGDAYITGDYKVISEVVKASELTSEGNSIYEFGYMPEVGSDKTNNSGIKMMPQSKAFKTWFGDSKITNQDGSPKVVFHGTGAGTNMFGEDIPDFDVFDRQASGRKNFDNIGSWFTDNKDQASVFGTNVKQVYLSIKKPWVLDKKDLGKDPLTYLMEMVDEHGSGDEFHDFVKSLDYDGIVIKKQEGDNFKKGDSDYFVALEPNQIKSATENSGDYNPDDPSYRMMPWKAMQNDSLVKYFQDNTKTPNIPVKNIKTISGQRVAVLEADRHDIRSNRMGGPLHPFLKMYAETAVEVDGKKWKPVWANMKWTMVSGSMSKVQNTTDGYALISIMDEIAHRSNKQSFRKAISKVQRNAKNMTPDERLMFAHIIDIASTKIASGKNKRQVLTQEQLDLGKKLTPIKNHLARGDIKKHRDAFQKLIDDHKQYDWWNDKYVNKIAKNFYTATKDSTFNQRALIMQMLMDFDHFPSIKKQLASEMDFKGATTDSAVAVVQLSKHKLNDKDNRIFAVYFGDDPKEAQNMSPKELEVRDKLLAQKNFKVHPSYDWVMLGPEDADNFVLDKQYDLDKLIPNYRNLHLSYKQKQLRDFTNQFIQKGMQVYAKDGKFSKSYQDMKASAVSQRNVIDGKSRVVVGAMKINGQVPVTIP